MGGAGPRELVRLVTSILAVTAFLALPPVARAIGVPSLLILTIGVTYVSCMALNDFVLHPAALKSTRAFNAQLVIVPLYNVFFCALVIVIAGDPKTPLWMMLLAFAVFTGSWQEIDPSIPYLAFHTVFPLLTIPLFLARGADPTWSVGGPLLCGLLSGLAYHGFAAKGLAWRRVRTEQAATIDELRRQASEAERGRIARDIHDSVGSVLGLMALYGDIIERNAGNPDELVRIARTLREAAREGLGEMRGVLDALAPDAADLSTLGQTLQRSGRRAAEASGAHIDVMVSGDHARRIDGPLRLSLVRVFQEAVNNALRHGHARRIDVHLTTPAREVMLEVKDDGEGFSLEAIRTGGRGLAGMRSRAAELGGTLEVQSNPGGGARVALRLPTQSPLGAAA